MELAEFRAALRDQEARVDGMLERMRAGAEPPSDGIAQRSIAAELSWWSEAVLEQMRELQGVFADRLDRILLEVRQRPQGPPAGGRWDGAARAPPGADHLEEELRGIRSELGAVRAAWAPGAEGSLKEELRGIRSDIGALRAGLRGRLALEGARPDAGAPQGGPERGLCSGEELQEIRSCVGALPGRLSEQLEHDRRERQAQLAMALEHDLSERRHSDEGLARQLEDLSRGLAGLQALLEPSGADGLLGRPLGGGPAPAGARQEVDQDVDGCLLHQMATFNATRSVAIPEPAAPARLRRVEVADQETDGDLIHQMAAFDATERDSVPGSQASGEFEAAHKPKMRYSKSAVSDLLGDDLESVQTKPNSRTAEVYRGKIRRAADKAVQKVEVSEILVQNGLHSIAAMLEFFELQFERAKGPLPKGACAAWCRWFVTTRRFELCISIVIVTNLVTMAMAVNTEVKNFDKPTPLTMLAVEAAFFVVYLVELIIKLIGYRIHFFTGHEWHLNSLDFLLVVIGALNLLDTLSESSSSMPQVSAFKALRVFKVLRLLRVLKVMHVFKKLNAILVSVAQSMSTLLWSIVTVMLFLYMFSVLFVQQTASFLEEGGDPDQHAELLSHFGSVQRSLIVLFKATTGDGWGHAYEVLQPTGGFTAAAYLFHVVFMHLAIVNIIMGIFVDTAMKSMASEREHMAMEHSIEEKQRESDLHVICKSVDKDNSGRISKEEWDEAFSDSSINQSFFELVGLRVHDVEEFFKMLMHSAEDEKVDIDEFVSGCMRLKGPASCFDTMAVISEVHMVKQEILEVQREVQEEIVEIRSMNRRQRQ